MVIQNMWQPAYLILVHSSGQKTLTGMDGFWGRPDFEVHLELCKLHFLFNSDQIEDIKKYCELTLTVLKELKALT